MKTFNINVREIIFWILGKLWLNIIHISHIN